MIILTAERFEDLWTTEQEEFNEISVLRFLDLEHQALEFRPGRCILGF